MKILKFLSVFWSMVLGVKDKDEELKGAPSLLEPKKILPEKVRFDSGKYNRKRRREGYFVLFDKKTGHYLKRNSKNNFVFCELEEANAFSFETIELAMNWALLSKPSIEIDYGLVYTNNGEIGVI